MNRYPSFELLQKDGKARLGLYHTAHGTFQTPQFMPVGTRASVKGVDVERLFECGAQIVLVNTYHLWVRPGPDLVDELGGIQRFMGWKGPVLSDSGGFQVYSLKGIRELSEEGVLFRSHLDGAEMFLTPEKAVSIQEKLGVDIAMVLDECPPGNMEFSAAEKSLEMTLRWAKRCLSAKTRSEMGLFAITQGALHPQLRKRAAEELAAIEVLQNDGKMRGFDGFAVGGLSVGEPKPKMYEVLSYHPEQLPADKIRYLMGVGTPQDIVQGVSEGIDLFDCVMPTRAGRFGRAFVNGETPFINIRNGQFSKDPSALDPSCSCIACRNYSKSHLHYLFRVEEMLGPALLSTHNLSHYLSLMKRIRDSIASNTFNTLYKEEQLRWQKKK